MMKKMFAVLLGLLFVSVSFITVNAAPVTISLLSDYEETGDINDVVHLGDRNYSSFIQETPSGTSWSVSFSLDVEPLNSENLTILIDHYSANPTRSYFNNVYLNGTDVGYLTVDSGVHWYNEQFTDSSSLLNYGSENTFKIVSGTSLLPGEDPSNYDDFEFTNVRIEYVPTPIPGAFLLFGSGLIGMIGLKRKFREK